MASEIRIGTETEMLRYEDKWKAVMSAEDEFEKGYIHTGIDPGLEIECTRCQLDRRGKTSETRA